MILIAIIVILIEDIIAILIEDIVILIEDIIAILTEDINNSYLGHCSNSD